MFVEGLLEVDTVPRLVPSETVTLTVATPCSQPWSMRNAVLHVLFPRFDASDLSEW